MRHLPVPPRTFALLGILLFSPFLDGAWAQGILSGTVVDPMGLPVAGVNIDILGINGSADPVILNDGTGVDGVFNVTVTPPGTYEVRFFPPGPPTTTLLNHSVPSLIISAGTTVLGNVQLDPGVQLTGTVVGPGGMPVAGVNLDVRLKSTGQNLLITGDSTNAAGQFILAVPTEEFELRLDTTPVGTSIAPHAIDLSPTTNKALGVIQLKQGYVITAIVRNIASAGVPNADYDVKHAATGKKLYTPGDNSNSTGFVDFVVPAGVYDFDVCPGPGTLLVADLQTDVTVAGNMSFGIVTLANGVLLTGTTFSHLGNATFNVDVDVNVSGTGLEIPLCGDNSDASGAYSVVVPPGGPYEVIFSPPYSAPLGLDVRDPISIPGNMVLNSNLPAQEFFNSVGTGTPGTGGMVPELQTVGGTPRLGNRNYALSVTNARGGSKVIINVGLGSCPSLIGWQSNYSTARVRSILLLLPGAPGTAGTGFGEVPIPVPSNASFVGLSIYASARVIDPQAVGGFALTPELCTAIAP